MLKYMLPSVAFFLAGRKFNEFQNRFFESLGRLDERRAAGEEVGRDIEFAHLTAEFLFLISESGKEQRVPFKEAFTEIKQFIRPASPPNKDVERALVYLLNRVLGVDFPVLWAMLAFLLNYVPNIGSFIAAVPAVLLASVQLGLTEALVLSAGYFAVNTLIGSGIEPRFLGRGLGLSTLVVWLSLVFWGWALGPVGMLLSVPLTVTLRIALENKPETHWIAVLLGPRDDVPEPPTGTLEPQDPESAEPGSPPSRD